MTRAPYSTPDGPATAAGMPASVRFEAERVGTFPPPTDTLLQEAIELLNQHFFSEEFKAAVGQAYMKKTLNLSSSQVYERLIQPTTSDGRIVMRLAIYPKYAGYGEVGVTTYKNGEWLTSTFAGYITENGAKCYAAHLAHEYCHWVGFSHPKFVPKKLTVPYVVGRLFAEHLGASC